MFSHLPRHEVYVETGHRALPAAPGHWNVQPMRSVVGARSDRNRTDLPLLTVARERGVFIRREDDDNHNAIPDDLSNYKVARKGDLVVNKMKAWQGSLGLAPVDGIVSPAYYVFDFEMHDREYGQYLLRSRPYVALMAAASDGVRIGQWDLVMSRFRQLPVLAPPSGEQSAIVKYLKHAHRRIDSAIAAKRKLVELLEEQRLVVTGRLIVGGANEGPTESRTEIGWLGTVPAHWQTKRAKYLFREYDARSGSGTEPLLSLRLHQGLVRHSEVSVVPPAAATLAHYKVVAPGSFVMNRMRAASGVFAVAGEVGLVSPDYSTMTSSDEVEPEYYLELFKTRSAMAEFRRRSSGLGTGEAGFMRLQFAGFGQVPLPLPPRQEQRAIVARIAEEGRVNRELSERTYREIELLHEFKRRITADVVTGQVDVRGIAATLPDLPEDEEAGASADAESDFHEDDLSVASQDD